MKVALVTGGSRGIGASAAMQLASRGMGVVLTYKSHLESAQDIVRKIESLGGLAVAMELDVSRVATFAAFRRHLGDALQSKWGCDRFDALVNNGSYGSFNALETVSEAEFDGLLNVHLRGPFFLTQTLLPLMADGGSIVNMTSATTRVATAGVAPYAAFKGALEVWRGTWQRSLVLAASGQTLFHQGAIRTDMTNGAFAESPEFVELLSRQTALGRIGLPDDVGRVIASILSDDSAWINGQNIEVAGGYNI